MRLLRGSRTDLAVLWEDARVPEDLITVEHDPPKVARRCPTLPLFGAERRLDFLREQSVNVSLTEAT